MNYEHILVEAEDGVGIVTTRFESDPPVIGAADKKNVMCSVDLNYLKM